LKGGAYSVYIKDSIGCIGKKAVTITQPNPVTVSFSKSDATCLNPKGSITLLKSGGPSNPPYQYMLTGYPNYTTNNTYLNLIPKNYIGYIKDALGCTANTGAISILPSNGCRVANDSSYNQKDINNYYENNFLAKIIQNPSNNRFELSIEINSIDNPCNLEVVDINGRIVYELNGIINSDVYQFGENLNTGVYFIKISNSKSFNVLKAIKVN
jgi:hypothetical protein